MFPRFDPHQGGGPAPGALESLTLAVDIDAPCIGEEGHRLLDPPAPGGVDTAGHRGTMRKSKKVEVAG